MTTPPPTLASRAHRLSDLARAAGLTLCGADIAVSGLSADSRRVRPGDLFVAVPGSDHDGLHFAREALEAGAVATCAVAQVDGAPTLVAGSPRAALADLAGIFLDHPTRDLSLVGVTGSLGKTSTALLAQGCLAGGGVRVGVIGSLGVRARGAVHDTGMTTPDALTLQQELRWMANEGGVGFGVMEVSSHGLLMERVRGIELALGIFTNLVPDEHLEFHPTPEHYIRTKLRFLELLRDGAPFVHNADDPIVAGAAARHTRGPVVGVTSTDVPGAAVRVRDGRAHAGGGEFTLVVERELRTLDGAPIAPGAHELKVPLLGRQQIENAAMAATAAILAGVPVADVARGMAAVEQIHRRMEVIRGAAPFILDDTVGNPRSMDRVRELAVTLPARSMRVAYAVRGRRGPTINQHSAAALAELVGATGAELVVTSSTDHADERNRVTDEERDATLATLRGCGVGFSYEPTLAAAVGAAMDGAGEGDVVLLLGAQGMDAGGELAQRYLAPHRVAASG